jgi:hypothetical protein
MYHDAEDHGIVSGYVIWYFFLFLGLVVAGVFIAAWLRPTWLGYEREAYVESHQYVETVKQEVVTLVGKYDELTTEIEKYKALDGDNSKIVAGLEMQQRSLKKRINAALVKISEKDWPEGSRRFK